MRTTLIAALTSAGLASVSLLAGPVKAQPAPEQILKSEPIVSYAQFNRRGTAFHGPRVAGPRFAGPRFAGPRVGGPRWVGRSHGWAGRPYVHGRRYGYYRPYRYYGPYGYYRRYDDWGGAAAAGILGLTTGAIIGGALSQNAPVYAAPNSSVAYCMRRFKSYDPASGTYLGYDGRRHACP
jgi:hypothetical protein